MDAQQEALRVARLLRRRVDASANAAGVQAASVKRLAGRTDKEQRLLDAAHQHLVDAAAILGGISDQVGQDIQVIEEY
jgi:hypothetical protein